MVYFVLIIVSALSIFGTLDRPTTSIHYLSLPASNLEKVFVNFLLVNVFYVGAYYLVMSLGALVGQVAVNLISGQFDMLQTQQVSWFSVYFNGDILFSFCSLYAMIAIAFLFSTIFKGRMGRSVLCFFGILIGLGILFGITLVLNIKAILPAGYHFVDLDWSAAGPDSLPLNELVVEIPVTILTMCYCYVLSYLRLRETEA